MRTKIDLLICLCFGLLAMGWTEAQTWTYGSRGARPGLPVVTEFMVPPGAASLEPRVVGGGRTGVVVKDFKVESLGNRLSDPGQIPASIDVETRDLKVSVPGDGAGLAVTDRRTARP